MWLVVPATTAVPEHGTCRLRQGLGITLSDRLSATDHVNNLLTSCSSLLYVMRVLRGHCISTESLHDVFRATILAKITYCHADADDSLFKTILKNSYHILYPYLPENQY